MLQTNIHVRTQNITTPVCPHLDKYRTWWQIKTVSEGPELEREREREREHARMQSHHQCNREKCGQALRQTYTYTRYGLYIVISV